MKDAATQTKRKGLRFPPDVGEVAYLDNDASSVDEFSPTIPALIVDESQRGCAVVARVSTPLRAELFVQVGRLRTMKAQVRWTKVLDEEVVKLGLEYLPL